MKVYIVCTCHPTCSIQHASPLTLSFNVKSKMTTDMLLAVILSELVGYLQLLLLDLSILPHVLVI